MDESDPQPPEERSGSAGVEEASPSDPELVVDPSSPPQLLRHWLLRRGLDHLDLAVHRDDEMLHYSILQNDGDFDAGVTTYFVSGAEVQDTLRQVVCWRWGGFDGVARLLDFGGGFGRLTRFLVAELGADRLWTAELQSEALEFQRQRFGVHTIPSSPRPEELRIASREGVPDAGFDLIWVGSLFTHLPDGTFAAWLRRLAGLLAPDGVLAFTVHDAALVPPGHGLDAGGMLFLPESESDRLDPAQYGSTWVSEAYVGRVLESIGVGAVSWRRFPRAVCRHQDLYLLSRSPEYPVDSLALDPGPRGLFERCTMPRPGQLEVSGWVAYPTGELGIEEVTVRLDGRVVGRSTELGERPDLVRILESEHARFSEFSCRAAIPVPLSRATAVLEVAVRSKSGREFTLFLGRLEHALYQAAHNNWVGKRREVRALEERIAWMESTRFWRLRRRWFAVKRALGLTDEE